MASFLASAQLASENPAGTIESTLENPARTTKLVSSPPYIFDADDHDGWLCHLREEGFVVLEAAASTDDVKRARSLLWDAIESRSPAQRDDPTSWAKADGLIDSRGFVLDGNVTQSRGAWFVRALPRVRAAFGAIWSTRALVCSMDAVIAWRPWWGATPAPPPVTEGLHLDQNPCTKPEFACVQGMLALHDVTAASGGLEVIARALSHLMPAHDTRFNPPKVVARSHLAPAKDALTRARDLRRAGDWCPLPHDYYAPGVARLLACTAGSLVLWDSRTVHGGRVGAGGGTERELARLSLAVCMVPRERATARVLAKRREGFEKGKTFTHWPDELRYALSGSAEYTPIELTLEEFELL